MRCSSLQESFVIIMNLNMIMITIMLSLLLSSGINVKLVTDTFINLSIFRSMA